MANLIPQLQTLTVTSTGIPFTLSSNQIIEFYNNGAGTNITYISQKGTTQNADVDESVSTINTAAGCTQAVSELFQGNTRTNYINSNRIVSFKVKTNSGDGVITLMKYKNIENAPETKYLKTAVDTINTAALCTYPITVPATRNTPVTTLYINSLLVDRIVKDTAETAIVLQSATVEARGTLMVAGTTVLTLSGGTFTTAATMLVTHTEAASRFLTNFGTGYAVNDTLTGTDGTGTKFVITITSVNGSGVITGSNLTTRGDYTVNPTLVDAPFVTNGSGTDALITLVMGAKTVAVATAGTYSVAPSSPVSTTGGGNNVKLRATFASGTVTGAQILYDRKGTAYQVIETEQTVAQLITLQNEL